MLVTSISNPLPQVLNALRRYRSTDWATATAVRIHAEKKEYQWLTPASKYYDLEEPWVLLIWVIFWKYITIVLNNEYPSLESYNHLRNGKKVWQHIKNSLKVI